MVDNIVEYLIIYLIFNGKKYSLFILIAVDEPSDADMIYFNGILGLMIVTAWLIEFGYNAAYNKHLSWSKIKNDNNY